MMKKILLVAVLAATMGGIAAPAAAVVYVQVAPPAPRTEVVPAPRPGHAWAPGYWDWRGKRHVWVAGHWLRERRGYAYAEPRWVERDGRWHMERRGWQRASRDRDGDGVPNRLDRRPDNPNRQ